MRRHLNKHHQTRNNSPSDHDSGDPQPGSDFVQPNIAGHFDKHVTDEKYSRAQCVNGRAESQVLQHLQLGEPDVYPVKIGCEIAQE